ncbi:MAG: hypothetical protein LBS36_08705 [Oscillospiraceae bacterium]|jgi:hypothetical protein|nr:hypothetical protein [Oscillospiraceae bacterium]
MNKTEFRPPFSVRLSKHAELCKAVLLFGAGYIFCYLFLLDYSQEGMNIFYRWSTTSYSQFAHPVLFGIWCILCAFAFFLNLDFLRRKYECPQKSLAVLQYLGFAFLMVTMLVPTHHAPHETLRHYLNYYVHLFSAMFYVLMNMACMMGIFFVRKKKDKRFKYWFSGSFVFIAVVTPLVIFRLCGFIETVPTLICMTVMYILNFTKLMDIPSEKTV